MAAETWKERWAAVPHRLLGVSPSLDPGDTPQDIMATYMHTHMHTCIQQPSDSPDTLAKPLSFNLG